MNPIPKALKVAGAALAGGAAAGYATFVAADQVLGPGTWGEKPFVCGLLAIMVGMCSAITTGVLAGKSIK